MGKAINEKLDNYIKSEKQARTIRVKTIIIAVVWFATVVSAFIFGGVSMSNFNDYIRNQVTAQVSTIKEVSKDQQ